MKIGIDIGSCYTKAVILDEGGRIADQEFIRHGGRPLTGLGRFQSLLDENGTAAGVTGSLCGLLESRSGPPVDEVQAMIRGSLHLAGAFNNILYLGSSSISLIKINAEGKLLDFRANSVCAAGTGSFLDQQAGRMGLGLTETARFGGTDDPPSVAARCAVFAKSDLIHRQQEGYTIPQLWCGLCRGLSFTITNTLLLGESLKGRTVVIGGVALNREVMRWLARLLGGELLFVDHPHLAPAVGAALLANGTKRAAAGSRLPQASQTEGRAAERYRPPLVLERSRFTPSAAYREEIDEAGNEIRLLEPLGGTHRVSLGMDVGSTSTKIALLTEEKKVVLDIYRRTAGDPIGAMKKLLEATSRVLAESGAACTVDACGTTGSGRKLVGQILGADEIVNEITAHARGALFQFGEGIETLFEIGGQDSKYVHMQGGRVDHVNMNYVCAAGTGSFVEEQAAKLGIRLQEIGDIVQGIAPPFTSERCTVFMERDVEKLLREGFTREESMAAVLYSVCFNYLTKVVGNRPVTGDRILFQGATAKNKGLVAAFEAILGREILTSHFCHVAGSIGAAHLARERVEGSGRATRFRGLDLFARRIQVSYSQCDFCVNHCKITHAKIEGDDAAPSWGYLCGREPEETRRKANALYEPFETRRRLFKKAASFQTKESASLEVTLPSALSFHAYLPLWSAFFHRLGIPTRVTKQTDREITEAGISVSSAEFCFPVKVFLGHVRKALDEGRGLVFLPHLINGQKTRFTTKAAFCPYVQASPSIAQSSELLSESLRDRLLHPVVDFSLPDWMNVRELHASLARFGFGRSRVRQAWKAGLEALNDFRARCAEEGRRILAETEASGQKAVVVVGRPYNVYDGGVNLEIPRKLSELGFRVIPYEFLPFDEKDLDPFFRNMFWYYGQRILDAARYVKERKNLFLLYLTNFSCGPDSFILTYVEEILGSRPFLILEMDEHSADAGYSTRLEAFADVMARYREDGPDKSYLYVKREPTDLRNKQILLPPMHPAVVTMFGAAFEKHGYRSLPLPEITSEQFELGRKHTRGSECLPAHVTTGNILHTLEARGLRPDEVALFMPTSDGPCRFGQYATLQRVLFNKLGYEDLTILSPSAHNAYLGLEDALRKDLWKGVLAGDVIYKLYCRVAPYEREPGEARRTFESVLRASAQAFRTGRPYTGVIEDAHAAFSAVPMRDVRKPLVGIVGEIFVRCNPFSCDRIVECVLENGCEPWLAPISEWILYTSYIYRYEARKRLQPGEILKAYVKNNFMTRLEHRAYEAAGELLRDRHEPSMEAMIEHGSKYFPVEYTAEAMLSVGRACSFISRDRAELIVNVSPFTCMPGTTTSAIFRQISAETGVPVVNMYYDGTVGVNGKAAVFLRNLGQAAEPQPTSQGRFATERSDQGASFPRKEAVS
ncbi:MAG: acyl-CoA dehydratase activase [bacterium]